MSAWSDWFDIDTIDNLAVLGKWPGVYQIRLAEGACATPINRLLDIDVLGLLGIGETVDLARRLKEFYKAVNEQRIMKHSAGDRLLFIYIFCFSSWEAKYKNSKLQFNYMKLSNKNKAQSEESKLLKEYFIKYGELPPLNNYMPDKSNWPTPIFS